MPEKKRVNLTVHPEKKRDWENAVEESTDYSSLSNLIRQSVAHELSDNQRSQPAGTEQTAQTAPDTEQMEQITDTLSNIESTLSDLDSRLTNVEKEVVAEATASLKNAVFAALPQSSNDNEPDGKLPSEIADDIGAEREEVSNILTKMETQTGTVQPAFEVPSGETAWVRDDK